MNAAIVIPARYASTRLPGKPLLAETGKPLIQHVYEQAMKCVRASRVVVATDDERILKAVKGFGGEAMMTRSEHETGGARVAEAAAGLEADIIVNLQGDEPEIDPQAIDRLIEIKSGYPCFAATLACPFAVEARAGAGSPDDPSAVKALLGEQLAPEVYRARFFTRTICPWPRDARGGIVSPETYFLHLGVYAYAKTDLQRFAAAPIGALERAERLEQLRILEMGGDIAVGVISEAPPGIDTPEDYARFAARMSERRR